MMFWDNNKNCWIGNEFYLSKSRIRFFNYFCNKACPTGLVRSANAASVVAVEIFVEENVIFEMGIGGEFVVIFERGTFTVGADKEKAREATGEFIGDFPDGEKIS